ncbi:MAG: hypothetical protein FJ149_12055 [Euryarchaeota archaeon]|nr:hypothetical protein [Euryarchaeota archaeon]
MARNIAVTVIPRKIGGSITLFLPASVVKRHRIREGVPVRVAINPPRRRARVLGVLKRGRRHVPFDRHAEGFWPDS